MRSRTVNISFNDDLLAQIDKVAGDESRSRSELIREAARSYIERKRRWSSIFTFSERQAERKGITEQDVVAEIRDYRRSRTTRE